VPLFVDTVCEEFGVNQNWNRRSVLLGAVPIGFATLVAGETGARAAQAPGDDAADIPLKTTAALALAYAFQTQTSLGLTADAFVHKMYDKPTCAQVLKSTIGFLPQIVEQLEDVAELDFDAADKAFFEKVVESLRLLKDEAQALNDFVTSGKESDRKQYLDLREQTKTVLDRMVKGAS
jgi:hypothetical protein